MVVDESGIEDWVTAREHGPRIVNGMPGTGKTALLLARYRHMLEAGTHAGQVLAWVSNQQAVQQWQQAIRSWGLMGVSPSVMTFRSWVRQELSQHWALVESSGVLPGKPSRPAPFFIGLTAAQQILADRCALIESAHPVLAESFTAPAMRRLQVLDAYARAIEHGVSYDAVGPRLDAGHDAGPQSGALHAYIQAAIASYREYCLTHRVLDYTMQLEVFNLALLDNRRYRQKLGARFTDVLVDDWEESFPIALRVIEAVSKSARSVLVACHPQGGLREYLGGDPVGARKLSKRWEALELGIERGREPFAAMAGYLDARAVDEAASPAVPDVGASVLNVHAPGTLRVQMFDALVARVQALVSQGVAPQQIAVIAPMVDPLLHWHVREGLARAGLPLRVLTGTNRVVDHRSVRVLTTLARLARPIWQAPPPESDVRELLESLLQLHPLEAPHVQRSVYHDGDLHAADTVNWPRLLENRREAYEGIVAWVTQMRANDAPLDVLLEQAFAHVYAPRCLQGVAPVPGAHGMPDEHPGRLEASIAVLQIDQLIQSARNHRHLMAALGDAGEGDPKRFLRSIYAGELAERPLIPRGSLPAAVTLYTAAKYAEEGSPVDHQIWVDVASPLWWKSDVREFINPRVLSRHWDGGVYSADDDQRDQAIKLGRTLVAMVTKCRVCVDVFASDHGSDGAELNGEVLVWLAELADGAQANQAASQEVSR